MILKLLIIDLGIITGYLAASLGRFVSNKYMN